MVSSDRAIIDRKYADASTLDEEYQVKVIKSNWLILGTMGLLLLGSCSNTPQANNSDKNVETATNTANSPKTEVANSAKSADNHKDGSHKHDESQAGKEHSHGGQVVETGKYHLELVSEKEAAGIHLDFYLKSGEKHETVPNAKVTAQVQLPDGTEKTLDLKYDSQGQHYAAVLPGNASDRYQVKVTADLGSEKVDGRFTINN